MLKARTEVMVVVMDECGKMLMMLMPDLWNVDMVCVVLSDKQILPCTRKMEAPTDISGSLYVIVKEAKESYRCDDKVDHRAQDSKIASDFDMNVLHRT